MVTKSGKNYYEILGVTPDVESVQLKSVYRRLVRKYHPDINPDGEDVFKEITNAYETLIDENKRKQYDILNGIFKSVHAETLNETTPQNTRNEEPYRKTFRKKFDTIPPEEHVFKEKVFRDVFNDILDGISSKKKKSEKSPQPQNGEDIYTDIEITLKESITGTCRVVNIMHTEVCTKCSGRKFINEAICSLCGGKGELTKHQKINVTIPPHIKNGAKLRIAGEGKKGTNGGKNGNLFLNVKIKQNSNFKIDGNNVYCEVPITPYEAVLGGEIIIPSLEGSVVLQLPPMTSSGQNFRMSAKGLKKNNKVGDIIITVRIEIPKKLTKDELELYAKLKSLSQENIRENLLND